MNFTTLQRIRNDNVTIKFWLQLRSLAFKVKPSFLSVAVCFIIPLCRSILILVVRIIRHSIRLLYTLHSRFTNLILDIVSSSRTIDKFDGM